MVRNNMLARKVANIFAVASLITSTVLPSVALSGTAKAAQLTNRSITMTSAVASTATTYTIAFNVPTAGTIRGIIVDFCTTALVGSPCTAPTGLNITSSGTITVDSVGFTVATATSILRLTNASGSSATANEPYTFVMNVTNPSTIGTFYARIQTYDATSGATNYTSASPGSYVDNGSVALSTTNNLTVTGIVTEQLTFCVGATDDTPNAADTDLQSCSASGFSTAKTIGLGVIDSSTPTVTPNATANGGTNTNGAFLVKTNAVNGATIGYRSILNTSSGRLKIPGATCGDNTLNTDACINSAGTTASTISGEEFGMAISQLIYPNSKTGDGTSNLVRDGEYDWSNSNEYAWDDTGTFDQIASSTGSATKVLDWELGVLKFSAISAPTTPSGLYTVSANFVATATF